MEPYDYTPDAMADAVAAAMAAKAETDAQDDLGTFPAKVSLAMAYVPVQKYDNLYDGGDALSHGTLFRSLDLPFYGTKNNEKGWSKP